MPAGVADKRAGNATCKPSSSTTTPRWTTWGSVSISSSVFTGRACGALRVQHSNPLRQRAAAKRHAQVGQSRGRARFRVVAKTDQIGPADRITHR